MQGISIFDEVVSLAVKNHSSCNSLEQDLCGAWLDMKGAGTQLQFTSHCYRGSGLHMASVPKLFF